MSEAAKVALFLVSCVLTDNFVFTRYLGERTAFSEDATLSASSRLGAMVALTMAVTSAVSGALYRWALVPLGLEYLNTVAIVLLTLAILWVFSRALGEWNPLGSQTSGIFTALVAVNSAVLGAALFGATLDFRYGALAGLFGGLGFWLAVVLMAGVRERVALSDVPESLKGLPISLVSAGLIGLALLGFSGFARALAL